MDPASLTSTNLAAKYQASPDFEGLRRNFRADLGETSEFGHVSVGAAVETVYGLGKVVAVDATKKTFTVQLTAGVVVIPESAVLYSSPMPEKPDAMAKPSDSAASSESVDLPSEALPPPPPHIMYAWRQSMCGAHALLPLPLRARPSVSVGGRL